MFSLFFFFKARLALNRGAQAVIFDITDDVNAANEVTVLVFVCDGFEVARMN